MTTIRQRVSASATASTALAALFLLVGCSTAGTAQNDAASPANNPAQAPAKPNAAIGSNGFQANCDDNDTYVYLTINNKTGRDLNEDHENETNIPFNYNAYLPAGGSGTVNACIFDVDVSQQQTMSLQYVDDKGNAYNIFLKQTDRWDPPVCSQFAPENGCQRPSRATVSVWWALNALPDIDDTPNVTNSNMPIGPSNPGELSITFTPVATAAPNLIN